MISKSILDQTWRLKWYQTLDSTNSEASRSLNNDPDQPVWFAAKEQTSGRGRSGRTWVSMEGNLFASLRLPVSAAPSELSVLALVVGLAVRDALVTMSHGMLSPRLKWPNDVRIDGQKISGILLEYVRSGDQGVVIIGIGMNLIHSPENLDYPVTSLHSLTGGMPVPPEQALHVLSDALKKRMIQIADNGRAAIITDWLEVHDHSGSIISTRINDEVIQGDFAGLSEEGFLLVKDQNGCTRTVSAGDVELIREVT